ncbi:MAG: hypothetical protein H9W81_07830 [Enterococcus sp.]|nr:hypothetical protein [Enterococcus sp.]
MGILETLLSQITVIQFNGLAFFNSSAYPTFTKAKCNFFTFGGGDLYRAVLAGMGFIENRGGACVGGVHDNQCHSNTSGNKKADNGYDKERTGFHNSGPAF